MADFRVDPEALRLTAKGINDAIAELEDVGGAAGAGVGRGFDGLELTHAQIGAPSCKAAFDEFCERWQWMVRGLVQTGNEIADKLNLSAGIYHEQEQYLSGTMKDVVTAAMGNPDLTQEQVEGRSWRQTLADNPASQIANADYSAQSFEQAAQHSYGTWKGVEADYLESNPMLNQLGDEDANQREAAKAKAVSEGIEQQWAARQAGGGR